MSNLFDDCLLIIFTDLQEDFASLYSCITVSRAWCRIALPILWKSFSRENNTRDYKIDSRKKLYNIITHFLPKQKKDLLLQNNIILPLHPFGKDFSVDYMSLFTHIMPGWIEDMVQLSISNDDPESEYKRNMLEEGIYDLIIKKCNSVKYFYWTTDQPIYKCPNAGIFFSGLSFLRISFKFITSVTLFGLAQICQNIINLEAVNCHEDTAGLICFINMQRNLRTLYIHFDNTEEEQSTMLSEVVNEVIRARIRISNSAFINFESNFFHYFSPQ